MSLPNAAARATTPLEVAPSFRPAATARILIVDDIADNRELLARRFQRHGFEITEADGGCRALELIRDQAFDVVLLDVMMPDLNGLEVLKRLREQHSPVSLPVIMVSARSMSDDIVHALQLGANDYVTKPVDFPVALDRVNTQVGRKRAEEKILQINSARDPETLPLGRAECRVEPHETPASFSASRQTEE
jgi:DNA-binding response OmpR family regulator